MSSKEAEKTNGEPLVVDGSTWKYYPVPVYGSPQWRPYVHSMAEGWRLENKEKASAIQLGDGAGPWQVFDGQFIFDHGILLCQEMIQIVAVRIDYYVSAFASNFARPFLQDPVQLFWRIQGPPQEVFSPQEVAFYGVTFLARVQDRLMLGFQKLSAEQQAQKQSQISHNQKNRHPTGPVPAAVAQMNAAPPPHVPYRRIPTPNQPHGLSPLNPNATPSTPQDARRVFSDPNKNRMSPAPAPIQRSVSNPAADKALSDRSGRRGPNPQLPLSGPEYQHGNTPYLPMHPSGYSQFTPVVSSPLRPVHTGEPPMLRSGNHGQPNPHHVASSTPVTSMGPYYVAPPNSGPQAEYAVGHFPPALYNMPQYYPGGPSNPPFNYSGPVQPPPNRQFASEQGYSGPKQGKRKHSGRRNSILSDKSAKKHNGQPFASKSNRSFPERTGYSGYPRPSTEHNWFPATAAPSNATQSTSKENSHPHSRVFQKSQLHTGEPFPKLEDYGNGEPDIDHQVRKDYIGKHATATDLWVCGFEHESDTMLLKQLFEEHTTPDGCFVRDPRRDPNGRLWVIVSLRTTDDARRCLKYDGHQLEGQNNKLIVRVSNLLCNVPNEFMRRRRSSDDRKTRQYSGRNKRGSSSTSKRQVYVEGAGYKPNSEVAYTQHKGNDYTKSKTPAPEATDSIMKHPSTLQVASTSNPKAQLDPSHVGTTATINEESHEEPTAAKLSTAPLEASDLFAVIPPPETDIAQSKHTPSVSTSSKSTVIESSEKSQRPSVPVTSGPVEQKNGLKHTPAQGHTSHSSTSSRTSTKKNPKKSPKKSLKIAIPTIPKSPTAKDSAGASQVPSPRPNRPEPNKIVLRPPIEYSPRPYHPPPLETSNGRERSTKVEQVPSSPPRGIGVLALEEPKPKDDSESDVEPSGTSAVLPSEVKPPSVLTPLMDNISISSAPRAQGDVSESKPKPNVAKPNKAKLPAEKPEEPFVHPFAQMRAREKQKKQAQRNQKKKENRKAKRNDTVTKARDATAL
jgi:hypothetical protein